MEKVCYEFCANLPDCDEPYCLCWTECFASNEEAVRAWQEIQRTLGASVLYRRA